MTPLYSCCIITGIKYRIIYMFSSFLTVFAKQIDRFCSFLLNEFDCPIYILRIPTGANTNKAIRWINVSFCLICKYRIVSTIICQFRYYFYQFHIRNKFLLDKNTEKAKATNVYTGILYFSPKVLMCMFSIILS